MILQAEHTLEVTEEVGQRGAGDHGSDISAT